MIPKINVDVRSEIGELEGVILHTPGSEIENMTPENAERALYSDILNLNVAKKEYAQLSGVLGKLTNTFQVTDLLTDILKNQKVKETLLNKICRYEEKCSLNRYLTTLDAKELSRQLIEGVIEEKNTLTKYLSKERYSLRPLHNFFFTRDSAISILDNVLIGRMANTVRERESLIMEAIFDYHELFVTKTINPLNSESFTPDTTIEGGDVLIARDDILCIGQGTRTTSQGIDFVLEKLKNQKDKVKHILVQELPYKPESFIHLDMVFTFLDMDTCMVYEPLIMQVNRFETIHIQVENGKVTKICTEENMLTALKKLGMDLNPIYCGGKKDQWIQEREQWHSGANFFAVGPGKVIGYERNTYTIEEMNKNGFEVLKANDIIKGKVNPNDHKKYVITIEGSELPRGGGGARCMTMPVRRKPVNW
ncbi:MAG: arginine deiminase [Bacteroidetes bacterium GWC2_33_15]|nr:MAG: arginine deiminase [Bacteroidetes bacterium GWA2_33_15]OFX50071.1 MAG: arginine deiminase [Bacteroidetes bacterium GWC2_33_15]OFX65224.1 MAG: arginine deiminase [Bacteroidetes bacterium GWB2_32_14]OFX70450.1 MAG: arginine deiminase [Bacteroidetes bacterium GWD2_33_33]HAN19678.1 arginine deiminase [Bacteroidales bacterium]